jgi:hypothetical protein
LRVPAETIHILFKIAKSVSNGDLCIVNLADSSGVVTRFAPLEIQLLPRSLSRTEPDVVREKFGLMPQGSSFANAQSKANADGGA